MCVFFANRLPSVCYASIALIGENDTDRQGKKRKKRIRNDRRKVIMKPELMEEKICHFHIFAEKETVKEQLVKQ